MEIIVLLLLLAVVYSGYVMFKNIDIANKNSIMLVAYCQMLYILMDEKKLKASDYNKLVATMWEIDSNLLDFRDFNKKYESICSSLKINVSYIGNSNTNMNPKTAEWIANKLWDNRHLFQQYTEQSERMKKISEDIINDPKYDY